MEMGLGFLVGILAGAMVALVVGVIMVISRRATGKNAKKRADMIPVAAVQEPGTGKVGGNTAAHRRPGATVMREAGAPGGPTRPAGTTGRGTNTIVIEEMDSRDQRLNQNIQEVRDLLLQLADVISSTENASGEAAVAFASARDTISDMDSKGNPADLGDAQTILVREIDRVLKSNAKLHSELDKANQGIAEQRRQIEELRVQARIDALTRIPNRASFDERLSEYISLMERTNLVFTLLLMDLDLFKRVNDEHGHINGDRILRGVASRITDSIRNNDFASRYGGEEFAVIFPGTDIEEAASVADRVRQDIAKTNFRMDDQNVKMTISGGLAEARKGMGPEQIIAAADAALYDAKRQGRNCVMRYGANREKA